MQAVVEHGGVGQSSQICLQTWAMMGEEVYPVAEVFFFFFFFGIIFI